MKDFTFFRRVVAIMLFAAAGFAPKAWATEHVWNSDGSSLTTIANGDVVTIEAGATGTLTVPSNVTITINGNDPSTPLEEQIVLYYSLTNLKQQMDDICYAALDILGSNEEGLDVEEYRTWIGRFNTVESEYRLAESYMAVGEFTEAEAILEEMPSKFPELDGMESHQNFMDYFAIVQECYNLPAGSVVPTYIIEDLVRLSDNNDFVAIKAYSLGEILIADWRELYPREFEAHPSCICSNTGGGGVEPPISGKGKGKGKQKSMDNDDTLEEDINNTIEIYPNPTTGKLQVTSGNLQIEKIEVYDVVGRLLKSENGSQKSETVIDVSHLANGLYFIAIYSDGQKIMRKFVKE